MNINSRALPKVTQHISVFYASKQVHRKG